MHVHGCPAVRVPASTSTIARARRGRTVTATSAMMTRQAMSTELAVELVERGPDAVGDVSSRLHCAQRRPAAAGQGRAVPQRRVAGRPRPRSLIIGARLICDRNLPLIAGRTMAARNLFLRSTVCSERHEPRGWMHGMGVESAHASGLSQTPSPLAPACPICHRIRTSRARPARNQHVTSTYGQVLRWLRPFACAEVGPNRAI